MGIRQQSNNAVGTCHCSMHNVFTQLSKLTDVMLPDSRSVSTSWPCNGNSRAVLARHGTTEKCERQPTDTRAALRNKSSCINLLAPQRTLTGSASKAWHYRRMGAPAHGRTRIKQTPVQQVKLYQPLGLATDTHWQIGKILLWS